MTIHTTRSSAHGDVLTAISDGMVTLLKEYHGRGPTQTKSYFGDDLVVCVMRGDFTRVEQNCSTTAAGHMPHQHAVKGACGWGSGASPEGSACTTAEFLGSHALVPNPSRPHHHAFERAPYPGTRVIQTFRRGLGATSADARSKRNQMLAQLRPEGDLGLGGVGIAAR